MAYRNNAFEYQKSAVNSASPVGLVIMLYDGAIRFMVRGKEAVAANDRVRQDDYLRRSQKVVLELMSSLDMYRGGEVSKNLFALYSYVIERLVEANIKDDAAQIDAAMKVMSDLRESWVEIEKRNRAGVESKEAVGAA